MSLRISEVLVNERRITPAQLEQAQTDQRANGTSLGFSLVKLGFVTDEEIARLLGRHYGVASVDLADLDIDREVLALIPAAAARKHRIVPLTRSGTTLTVAMTDPTNVVALDEVTFRTGCQVVPAVAAETAVTRAIARYYGGDAPASPATTGDHALERATRELEQMALVRSSDVTVVSDGEDARVVTLAMQDGENPVVRLVHVVIASAIRKRASDIHVEPYERACRIRFRIDGVLCHVLSPPAHLRDAITSRLKVMAKLDIAERRRPQDGRIKVQLRDDHPPQEIDLRVSCVPTLFGEKVVLRLLDKRTLALDLTTLGFEPEVLARFERSIHRPWGLVLVTGPTGSGKTSTLYSSIARLNAADVNITTVEDPVEFNLAGVNQVQIRDGIGLTFAAVLRALLRQDPDIILVGEIRDVETAEMAIKAALTGHLVLSTLHTNDAPSTVTRLINMGVEPYLVAGSLTLVCAQRLVRRICTRCRRPEPLTRATLVDAGFPASRVADVEPRTGTGCDRCHRTGYRDRIGLFEVMEVTDPLRDLMVAGRSSRAMREAATAHGMRTLRQSGLRKIEQGVTSVAEVMRETVWEP